MTKSIEEVAAEEGMSVEQLRQFLKAERDYAYAEAEGILNKNT